MKIYSNNIFIQLNEKFQSLFMYDIYVCYKGAKVWGVATPPWILATTIRGGGGLNPPRIFEIILKISSTYVIMYIEILKSGLFIA